jgi:hypothetical protein
MGAMGLGLSLAFGRRTAENPPPPASVASPVVGTDLTTVWNLQYSGTGTNAAFSNGTWNSPTPGAGGTNTNLDAYLQGLGFIWDNVGKLRLNFGSTNVTVANYDFTGLPGLNMDGLIGFGVTFTNCRFKNFTGTGTVKFPANINDGLYADGILTNGTCTFTNCTFDKVAFDFGCGGFVFNYCRFTNQTQGLGDVAFGGLGSAALTYDYCYITGGGVAPGAGAHVEFSQFSRGASAAVWTFSCTNTMIDISKDGQTTTAPWGSGWTALWSLGSPTSTISNCIMIGVTEVNANPANPNVIPYDVVMRAGVPNIITNNIWQIGQFGYLTGKTGATISGNRTYANAALTAADFS